VEILWNCLRINIATLTLSSFVFDKLSYQASHGVIYGRALSNKSLVITKEKEFLHLATIFLYVLKEVN
jgi:hypothetical protein